MLTFFSNFLSFETKSYKKFSFTDASTRSGKTQEYIHEMGFPFSQKFHEYSKYFALHTSALR